MYLELVLKPVNKSLNNARKVGAGLVNFSASSSGVDPRFKYSNKDIPLNLIAYIYIKIPSKSATSISLV